MTSPGRRGVESICLEALARPVEERRAFLDGACAGDVGLRQQVEALLARAAGFMEAPAWAAPSTPLTAGTRIGPYEIQSAIGAGGMGEVYKARDTRLDRTVAIKVLPPDVSGDPERRARFEREAKAIAGLTHPHICSLHDVGEQDGAMFLVMEHLSGETLAARLVKGRLPLDQALSMATEIADALSAAHRQGIIHRDLKPANIMVTPEGQVKVLDYGLAKHLATAAASPEVTLTAEGAVVGTVSYMSPEQVEAKPLDPRSDIFSFGAVLYELLTGQRAFRGDSALSTMAAILRDTPVRPTKLRADVPHALESIVARCLEKDRDRRFGSSAELHGALVEFQGRLSGRSAGITVLLRPRIAVPAALILAAVLGMALRFGLRGYRASWARDQLLPEIARLADEGRFADAFAQAELAKRVIPGDRTLQALWPRVSMTATVVTDPPGASVSMKEYAGAEAAWRAVGRTPLVNLRVARSYFRWRTSLEGFEDLEFGGPAPPSEMSFRLVARGTPESGMACLPGGRFFFEPIGFDTLGPWPIEPVCIDRFEVTNGQFKRFVDAGGYRTREYWREPFLLDGRKMTWEEAMARLVDSSGRPGPATWEAGSYREGADTLPVGGVSWYEAAAYAEFVGKSLPTFFHWYHAAGPHRHAAMVPLSNFTGMGAAEVGRYPGVSPYGVYDLAGNHREWTLTATRGRRYALGGAWNEPTYLTVESEARDPFDRAAENGFRCATYRGGKTPPAPYAATLDKSFRDYAREKPASDDAFEMFARFYPRDTGPLDARVESEDSSPQHWRKLKVSYSAGYGGERLPASLFLPKNAAPPYQAVVYFPSATPLHFVNSEPLVDMDRIDFIIQSGRAVLHPIYKGTYERQAELPVGGHTRESVTWWLSEVRRSVDYLESRPDVDAARIAYGGTSWGARLGSVFLAMEPRFRLGVLFSGGYNPVKRDPEIDDFNYTPRVSVPVLMINGRHDFVFPFETSSGAMFRNLGTVDESKKHVVLDSVHNVWTGSPRAVTVRETLDWLDRYLGPVRLK